MPVTHEVIRVLGALFQELERKREREIDLLIG